MRLTAVEPSDSKQDLRTFTCPYCKREQRHIIAGAATEAPLDPKRVISKAKAVTYVIHEGRLVPKSK